MFQALKFQKAATLPNQKSLNLSFGGLDCELIRSPRNKLHLKLHTLHQWRLIINNLRLYSVAVKILNDAYLNIHKRSLNHVAITSALTSKYIFINYTNLEMHARYSL